MILAIDVGNTNIVLGCLEGISPLFVERLSTVKTKTELEYAVDLKTVLDIYGIDLRKIEGSIISSVVPQITESLQMAVEKIIPGKRVLTLGPGIKTGINIIMDQPSSVGADLVAAAVAGMEYYPVPLALIDMGTATTVTVVDQDKRYIGGMIYPGVQISLNALVSGASQLSSISLDAPKRVIGKNTIECMKSGVLFSNAAAIDGILDRMEEELGMKLSAVATGGLAKRIIPLCRRNIVLDEELVLKGLALIFQKNVLPEKE